MLSPRLPLIGLGLAVLSGCGSGSSPTPSESDPPAVCAVTNPNIVLIVADDLRTDAIGALGNTVVRTPNLDDLAQNGTTIRNAIVSQPVCLTSRAELLTGLDGFASGIHPPVSNVFSNNVSFLPNVFQDAGYATWHIGKWHVDGRPWTRGYSDVAGLFHANATSAQFTQVNGLNRTPGPCR